MRFRHGLLGLASAAIALALRTFNAFGVLLPGTVMQGITIWYMSFYKAALLFFLINIATAISIYSHIQVPNRDGGHLRVLTDHFRATR